MSQRLQWIIFNALALAMACLPSVADAQGFGRDSQRRSQRGGAVGEAPSGGSSAPRSSGGFGIQIGPGGVQFGTGSQQPQQSHQHGQHSHHDDHHHHSHSHNHQGNSNPWIGPSRPPVLVQPQTILTLPLTPAPPSPPAEPILLVNPAGNPAPVQYRVNQYSYVLKPGSTQQLGGDRAWTIDYDRGTGYGRQTYGLTPGRSYRFAPGQRGWDLFVIAPEAPLILGQ